MIKNKSQIKMQKGIEEKYSFNKQNINITNKQKDLKNQTEFPFNPKNIVTIIVTILRQLFI